MTDIATQGVATPRVLSLVKNFATCGNILCGQELTSLLLFSVVRLVLGLISNNIVVQVSKLLVRIFYPFIGDVVGIFIADKFGITFD